MDISKYKGKCTSNNYNCHKHKKRSQAKHNTKYGQQMAREDNKKRMGRKKNQNSNTKKSKWQ